MSARLPVRAAHKFTMWDDASEEQRFWAKVAAADETACWPWLGAKSWDGYARFRTSDRRTVIAHRMAYELRVGPIPQGLTLDHLCRNKLCMNPAHLEAVTRRENLIRAAAARKAAR